MPVFHENKRVLLLLVAGIACLLTAFWGPLASLVGVWGTEEYSHGPLIPLLAVLLGAHRLADKKPPVGQSWIGVIFLIGAGGVLFVGRLSAFEPPTYYALWCALIGMCLSFYGRRVTAVLAPAFIYLLFAIPLPRLIYVALSADFQLLSSTLGTLALQGMGIPVFQEGNIIDLGTSKLQVAEACSGLRYLFPLMSFGFLVGYMLEDAFWKRALLFVSTVPIVVVLNALRIAGVGVTVDLWGDEMAHGFLHMLEGGGIFLVCLLILMGEVQALLHFSAHGRFRYDILGFAKGPFLSGAVCAGPPTWGATVIFLGLALVASLGLVDGREDMVPPHQALIGFPMKVGEWRGSWQTLDPVVSAELRFSDYLLADYSSENTKAPVNLYVAWYDRQRAQASAHSPANCIPGSGWQVDQKNTLLIETPGTTLRASRLVAEFGTHRQLVYYWFDERGRTMPEQYQAKWYLFWDALFMHRSDGAVIRLITPIGKNEAVDEADARLKEFILDVYPLVQQFLPGKI